MNNFERIIEIFREFPGIGPRQAKRFAYFLASKNTEFIDLFIREIRNTKNNTRFCSKCFRLFYGENLDLCEICTSSKRDKNILVVVSNDSDFEAIERGGVYGGNYFVLGGLMSMMGKSKRSGPRLEQFKSYVEREDLKEIIFALALTVDGEYTRQKLVDEIYTTCQNKNTKISTLGRGVSSGTEIEYLDKETIKNALDRRV